MPRSSGHPEDHGVMVIRCIVMSERCEGLVCQDCLGKCETFRAVPGESAVLKGCDITSGQQPFWTFFFLLSLNFLGAGGLGWGGDLPTTGGQMVRLVRGLNGKYCGIP